MTKTTGVAGLDMELNRELDRLATVFGVFPAFFIVPGNGASALGRVYQQGTMNTVEFGYDLLVEEFRRTGANNFTIPAVLAHEFTHVAQGARHTSMPRMGLELQADYMAGWYIANRQRFSVYANNASAQTLAVFFSKGDELIDDPDHHGTDAERARSALLGMLNGNASFDDAYALSLGMFRRASSSVGIRWDPTSSGPPSRERESELPEVVPRLRNSGSSAAPRTQQVEEESEASAMRKVLALAERNQLDRIKGEASAGSDDTWQATIQFPGESICYVKQDEQKHQAYECTAFVDGTIERRRYFFKLAKLVEDMSGVIPGKMFRYSSSSSNEYKSSGGANVEVFMATDEKDRQVVFTISPPER